MNEVLYTVNVMKLAEDCMLSRALLLVTQSRREKALRYMNRADAALSVGAELLLLYALAKDFGFKELPVIAWGEHGKPFFKKPEGLFFSLSHSGEYAACAVSDSREAGIDIERIRQYNPRTARRVFTETECRLLENTPEPERDALFTELWVRRESMLKLRGKTALGKERGRGVAVSAPEGYRAAAAFKSV